jgi:hypothetical protein
MMMLMLLACVAIWALVALMLGDARVRLLDALCGVQTGGWMPSASPVGAAARRPAPSRDFTRA